MRLKSGKFGLFWGCDGYPKCEATHGAHPDGTPLGIPADRVTKQERIAAHLIFDQLWMGPLATMTRTQAYHWMQKAMGKSVQEAHIGRFDVGECRRLQLLLREHFGADRVET